jgi:hypothetical protein
LFTCAIGGLSVEISRGAIAAAPAPVAVDVSLVICGIATLAAEGGEGLLVVTKGEDDFLGA